MCKNWRTSDGRLTAYSSGVTLRTSNTTASKLFFNSEPLSLNDSELLLFWQIKKKNEATEKLSHSQYHGNQTAFKTEEAKNNELTNCVEELVGIDC